MNIKKQVNNQFQCIAIIGKLYHKKALITYQIVHEFLQKNKYKIIMEKNIASILKLKNMQTGNLNFIGKNADLAIVIGGDGNMLHAARILSNYNIKLIGINRGNLGFLTDLNPNNLEKQLSLILQGKYSSEYRFLLEVVVYNNFRYLFSAKAVNEVICYSKKIAHMIDFNVHINDKFVFSQRSNGLIISTPTGSTAYSLSAGGPIIEPSLEVIALVPMFPHCLSNRPLLINNTSIIHLSFNNTANIAINCDSQIKLPVKKNTKILIRKSYNKINLIHPLNYNYFNTLISKLGWLKKLF